MENSLSTSVDLYLFTSQHTVLAIVCTVAVAGRFVSHEISPKYSPSSSSLMILYVFGKMVDLVIHVNDFALTVKALFSFFGLIPV